MENTVNLYFSGVQHNHLSQWQTLKQQSIDNLFQNNTYRVGVLIEKITDPNNIGSIYRSAYGFNIDFIITVEDGSLIENSYLVNNACGTFDKVNRYSTVNAATSIKKFKKITGGL